jgi:GTPase-associated protein 1
VRVADQFLFGYDDGHRLLAGSRELPGRTALALLEATDAAMSQDADPLVTGLALRERREYAFCVTWSAPEAPRPGAVWAHALIVGEAELDDPALDVLIGLPRCPAPGAGDFSEYLTPLELEGVVPAAPGYLPGRALDRDLLERLALNAYGRRSDPIVVHDELADAASVLVALWRAQWPALRAAFSFRTREVVREGPSEFDLTVARRIRGTHTETAPGARPLPSWLKPVTDDAVAATPKPLRDWLLTFGPLEPPEPSRLAALAALWPAVVARDAAAARRQLERDWPAKHAGTALKRVLFAPENDDWWAG